MAPGFVPTDHRLLGWGETLLDGRGLIRSQQVLVELSPDVRYRSDHMRVSGRAVLAVAAQVGTREGGAFENRFAAVQRFDESGRMSILDVWDVDQLAAATARFEELRHESPSSPPDPRLGAKPDGS